MHIRDLPFPRIGQRPKDYTNTAPLILEQWIVPIGTKMKLWQTRDFGYVILPLGTQDTRRFEMPKRIFRY